MFARLARAVARFDSWLNVVTGVGGNSSKVGAFAFNATAPLPDETLRAIYEGDGYAARIIDCVPDEATRQGVRVRTADEDVDAALSEAMERLDATAKLNEAWAWGRLFGGGAIFVGADDGNDPATPLVAARIRSVRFLTVLERRELQAETWVTDPLDPHFGDVATYRFTRSGGGGGVDMRLVHRTRLIRFFGARATRHRRTQMQGWGMSELQRVYDKLQQFNATYAAVGELLQDGSQGVFKIKDLYGMLAGDKRGVLKDRMEVLDMSKSVARSILVDADGEEYQRVEASAMSGYPDTIDRFALFLAGAAGIPVTILLGQAPAGLSATGDSDIRWFYDRVRTQQQNILVPRVRRLAKILLAAEDGPTRGALPRTVKVECPPLWQLTEAEKAALRAQQAATDAIYVDKEIVTREEVAIARFGPDGWSGETTIDLDARRAAQQAALEGEGDEGDADRPTTDAARSAPTFDHDAASAVVARVAAREIPRASGLAQLAAMGVPDPEAVMSEAGATFFTKANPNDGAEMERLRAENAKLARSQQSTKAMLSRVLERNRNGELVVGRLIAKAPTDTDEGDVLEEGDTIPAEDRADGGDGAAVVLVVPADVAAVVALPGGTPAADLHVTLAFFGVAADLSPEACATLRAVVAAWAASQAPLPGVLNGFGRFLGAERDPVYRSPDVPRLAAAREALAHALASAGIAPREEHGFVPHVTVTYVPCDAPTPVTREPIALTFTEAALWLGSVRESFPLAAPPRADELPVAPVVAPAAIDAASLAGELPAVRDERSLSTEGA